ncbi:MAG: type II secretion system F family protein, partial [Acidiferrobacterales bacterium]|nr:type II secretion system F family protein [Acidiferrobacterales bacterium]
MRRLANERERIRLREREQLGDKRKIGSLRKEPKKVFKKIVEHLNLAQLETVSKTGRLLRMAGYRGEAAVITFLAVRFIAPFVMFALSLIYIQFVLKMPQPMVWKLFIALVCAALGYYGPQIFLKNKIIKRQQMMSRAWPDALDLMLICVESGMSIEAAFRKVSEEIGSQSIELAEEVGLTTAELSYLQDRRQAFDNLGERTGLDAIKAVVASLKQAEKHGTSIGGSLRVLAQESRNTRISLAEKKAAALPPKLTVPMILF